MHGPYWETSVPMLSTVWAGTAGWILCLSEREQRRVCKQASLPFAQADLAGNRTPNIESNTHLETPRRERMKWDEMKIHGSACWVFGLAQLPFKNKKLVPGDHNSFAGTSGWAGQVSARTLTLFVGSPVKVVGDPCCWPFVSGFLAHNKPHGRSFYNEKGCPRWCCRGIPPQLHSET